MSCSECHGEGVVMVAGYSRSPFSGVLVSDPQEARDAPCDACGGSGLAQRAPVRALPKAVSAKSAGRGAG